MGYDGMVGVVAFRRLPAALRMAFAFARLSVGGRGKSVWLAMPGMAAGITAAAGVLHGRHGVPAVAPGRRARRLSGFVDGRLAKDRHGCA